MSPQETNIQKPLKSEYHVYSSSRGKDRATKDSILETKWNDLKRRGIIPPDTLEEHQRRLKEAHGG